MPYRAGDSQCGALATAKALVKRYSPVSVGLLVACALAGCASPELEQAHRFANEDQWDQAVTAYQDAQRKAPFE